MSSTIDIVFDRDLAGYEPDDRCSLAFIFFESEFEDLAKQLGVVPLTKFYSDDPDSLDDCFDDDFFDDPKELEALKQKMGPTEYFDPAHALESVTVIRDELKRSPLKLRRPGRKVNQDLVNELAEIEQSLEKAKNQGVKFYFVLTE